MDWWNKLKDTASDAFDTTLSTASEWYGNFSGDVTSEPAPTQSTATRAGGVPVNVSGNAGGGLLSNINWTIVGVIIAALGLLFAVRR